MSTIALKSLWKLRRNRLTAVGGKPISLLIFFLFSYNTMVFLIIVVFLVPAEYSGYNVSQSRQGVKCFCTPGRKGYNRILYGAVAKLVKRGEFYP